jgi:hypothetical protein
VIHIFCKCERLKIYRTIIVPVVLYGCETWLLTLREERRLRVLRRVFWLKRDEVTGEWGKLHYGELNDLYSSPSIVRVIKSRRVRWVGHVVHIGERRGIYRALVGKCGVKRPFGKPRPRKEDSIKMDLQEVGCGVWTGLSWLRIGTGCRHLCMW